MSDLTSTQSAQEANYIEATNRKARIASVLLAAGLATILSMATVLFLRALGISAEESAKNFVRHAINVPDSTTLNPSLLLNVIDKHPAIMIFLFYFAIFLFTMDKTANHIAKTAWSSFRSDLFGKIQPFRSVTDPERFAPDIFRGPQGNVDAVFTSLTDFARSGAHDRFRIWPPNGVDVPFAWTVVTGQSGAGKSRIVTEVALQLDRTFGPAKLSSRRHALIRRVAWIHEEVPFLRRNLDHPWDVGKVTSWRKDFLKDWLPRKPTLLVLDDAEAGLAAKVIGALGARAGSFRKPVRLVFVGQTLPMDLQLRWEGEHIRDSGLGNFALPPPTVRQNGELAQHLPTLRAFVAAIETIYPDNKRKKIWNQLGKDTAFQLLAKITEGNPLLVELVVDDLADGRTLADIHGREDILARRAHQVVRNLERAGLCPPGADRRSQAELERRALAVATLADGPEWGRWIEAVSEPNRPFRADRDTFRAAFPHSQEAGELAAYFRAEDQGSPRPIVHAPPIRPDLVADAVLDYWVNEQPDASGAAQEVLAKGFVTRAWRAGSGVQRAVRRRSAYERNKKIKSPLTAALQATPSIDAFTDEGAYVNFMIDNALRFGLSVSNAEAAIANLPAQYLLELEAALRAVISAPGLDLDAVGTVVATYVERREMIAPVSAAVIIDFLAKVLPGDDRI